MKLTKCEDKKLKSPISEVLLVAKTRLGMPYITV